MAVRRPANARRLRPGGEREEDKVSTSGKHTYLRTHEISGKVLRFRLSEEDERLREPAAASKSGRAGKTLVKEGPLRITQVALRKGTPLQGHQVAGAVSLLVQRGRFHLVTTEGTLALGAGEMVVLDAGVAHAAAAVTDCAILITMAIS